MSVEEIHHWLLRCDRCGTEVQTWSTGSIVGGPTLPDGWEDDVYVGTSKAEYGTLCRKCTKERDKLQDDQAMGLE